MANYSGVKIAKAVIKSNVNFWGGKNIPIVQSTMNFLFDPKKFMEQFKVDDRKKTEAIRFILELRKVHDEAIKAEMDFDAIKKAYSVLNISMIHMELIITSIYSQAFTTRISHSVSTSTLNNYKLTNKVQPHNFYALDTTLNIDRAVSQKYYEGVTNLKTLEQQLSRQDGVVRQKYSAVKTKTEALIKKTAANRKNR